MWKNYYRVNKPLPFLLFTFLFISSFTFGQINNKFWIQGKVIDSAGVVKDVNVLNLKTNIGTFTNDFGDYKMLVSIGDSIQYTSVNHQTVIRVMKDFHYRSEVVDVFMPVATVELDEFDLKKHDLDGYLSLDSKKTPEDKKAAQLQKLMDFSNVDMNVRYDGDFIDQNVRPPVAVVDPTANFVGLGAGGAAYFAFKHSEKMWAQRRLMDYKKEFPKLLVSEFGEKFFEDDLGIPKDKYYHFLEYCNPKGIESLYKKNKKIEVINILRKESKSYLAILESNEKE